jgi:hypothetical protein
MYEALHPDTGEKISAKDYVKDFGATHRQKINRAKCPFCNDDMKLVTRQGTAYHFAHIGNAFCPSKESSAKPYKNLRPQTLDKESAITILNSFKQNWKYHYQHLTKIIPCFSYNEFLNLLHEAKTLHIWYYSGIQEFQIPYIFATLIDFPPENGIIINYIPKRKLYFRFWFDASVKSYYDLWIQIQSEIQFWRASYNVSPNHKIPHIADINKFYPLEYSDKFLKEIPQFPEWIVPKVENFLAQYTI